MNEKMLKSLYQCHMEYVLKIQEICRENSYPLTQIRMPNMPEYITENLIRFVIINHLKDSTCVKGTTGDLFSSIEGIQECKTFSSDGPISFGPDEKWDTIYFLDARKWLDNQFTLFRLPYSNTSDIVKNIKVNKKETFFDQCQQQRRPRISWNGLYHQIDQYLKPVYSGTFEDIFL